MNFNWGITWFHLITTQHKSTFFYTQKEFVSQIYHFFRFLFSLSMCHSDNIFHSIDWNGQPRNSFEVQHLFDPMKNNFKIQRSFYKDWRNLPVANVRFMSYSKWIGIEYRNWNWTLNVYSLFAILQFMKTWITGL